MRANSSQTIRSFIDEKIKDRDSEPSEDPVCVLNLDNIVEKLLKWRRFLPRVEPFFAPKCSGEPSVLKMLSSLGTGFDCASKKEMELVKDFVVDPDKIIYAHPAKPQSHIEYARDHGVKIMTFDCVEELHKISMCHAQARLVLQIEVDDFNEKFGAKLIDVGDLLKQAKKLRLNVIGVSFHVGSVRQNSEAYKMAIKDARRVFDQAKTLGFQMNFLDIGGGFNGRKDDQTSIEQMSIGINEALDEDFPADSEVKIIAEPGPYFVDTACTLAVNIIAKKVKDNGYGLETFKYYVSDGIYGSMCFKIYNSETYTFYPHRHREDGVQTYPSIICGPSWDILDKLTDIVQLPKLEVGEWLLVHGIGANSAAVAGCDVWSATFK